MKALSIRQPWAWLILNAGKDIENRDWPTRIRGRILIHASKGMTHDEHESAADLAYSFGIQAMPTFEQMERGGIVGSVELVDCVERSESRWFFGDYGFALRDPRPITFIPFKGALLFFDVPDSIVADAVLNGSIK